MIPNYPGPLRKPLPRLPDVKVQDDRKIDLDLDLEIKILRRILHTKKG